MINQANYPILPDHLNTIGILGGGQLGKMIALAAIKLICIVLKVITQQKML